jgi:Carboxypeptidase regulatory-like domain
VRQVCITKPFPRARHVSPQVASVGQLRHTTPRSSLAALLAFAAAVAARPAGAQALRGKVVAADGSPVAGVRVSVRAGERVMGAAVDSTGAFAIDLPQGAKDTLEVRAEAPDSAFYPAVARITRDELLFDEGFVLVPRRWTVIGGRYDGQSVPLDLERAFRPACNKCSGFYRFRGGRTPSQRGRLLSWPSARLPLRVAFDRDRDGGPQLGPRDSAAFWEEADSMQAIVGARLFRPSSYPDALPREGGPDDVVLVRADPTLRDAGLTTVISGVVGITYAATRIQSAGLLREPFGWHLVAHELFHALGIGHTCAWTSVMAEGDQCPGMRSDAPTAQDVAYLQLLLRVRQIQRDPAFGWGMEAALDALGIARPGNVVPAPMAAGPALSDQPGGEGQSLGPGG